MMLQTEYEFTLPKGFIDEEGGLHRNGVMRLATAYDEIVPLKDPRIQKNPSYLTIEDLAYLQEFYHRINGNGNISFKTKCTHCGEEVEVNLASSGE
jgi:hypothetical protein